MTRVVERVRHVKITHSTVEHRRSSNSLPVTSFSENMDRRTLTLGTAVAWFIALSCAPSTSRGADKHRASTTARFLRVSGADFVPETEIHLTRTKNGSVVTSTTQRGEQKLTVISRYDSQNGLTEARVTSQQGTIAQSAEVRVTGRTAHVMRDGQRPDELRCPAGVIVTSAPDWTDSFMAVRRYDSNGEKTQTFPGLWIHPTGKPLELTIQLTHLGQDSVKHGSKTANLDRYLLVLRGGSRYVVWRNPQGQLVRLVPAKSGRGGIVLAGWEQAVGNLKPPPTGN